MRVVIDTNVVVSAYAGSTSSACSLPLGQLTAPDSFETA